MSVKIAIKNIKEEEFKFVDNDINKINPDLLSIGFKIDFKWDFENEYFFILLSVIYEYGDDDDKFEMMKFVTQTTFNVVKLSEILKVKKDKNFELDDFFMMTFISIAVSSARGMLVYKLAGTILSSYYIPLIDPKEFSDRLSDGN